MPGCCSWPSQGGPATGSTSSPTTGAPGCRSAGQRPEPPAPPVDGIATLEPELTETDYRGLVSAVLSRVRKRALVVLFVTLDRPAMEEGLIPALPALTARHTVLVASVREPAPASPAPTANLRERSDPPCRRGGSCPKRRVFRWWGGRRTPPGCI